MVMIYQPIDPGIFTGSAHVKHCIAVSGNRNRIYPKEVNHVGDYTTVSLGMAIS